MKETIYQHQQHDRISPKTKSIQTNSQLWKDNLRNECMKRAKMTRRELLLNRRRECITMESETEVYTKVNREVMDAYNDNDEHNMCLHESKLEQVAKTLVKKELQRSIIELDRNMSEVDKRLVSWSEETDEKESRGQPYHVFSWGDEAKEEEEYKIPDVDYFELLNAVTEELQREGE